MTFSVDQAGPRSLPPHLPMPESQELREEGRSWLGGGGSRLLRHRLLHPDPTLGLATPRLPPSRPTSRPCSPAAVPLQHATKCRKASRHPSSRPFAVLPGPG